MWTTPPSKTPLTLPTGGIAGNGNAGVAADIENTPNSIGYVEYSYVLFNPSLLKGVAAIVNRAGVALAPSIGGHRARGGCQAEHHLDRLLDRLAARQEDISDSRLHLGDHLEAEPGPTTPRGRLLVKYLDWLSHSGAIGATAGQDVAALQGYVPLPANIQALARKTLLQVTGSKGQPLLTTNGG